MDVDETENNIENYSQINAHINNIITSQATARKIYEIIKKYDN